MKFKIPKWFTAQQSLEMVENEINLLWERFEAEKKKSLYGLLVCTCDAEYIGTDKHRSSCAKAGIR